MWIDGNTVYLFISVCLFFSWIFLGYECINTKHAEKPMNELNLFDA